MPISFRSSRKLLIERSRWRISESLCWTRGWATTLTLAVMSHRVHAYEAVRQTENPANSAWRLGASGKLLSYQCRRVRHRLQLAEGGGARHVFHAAIGRGHQPLRRQVFEPVA